MSELTTEEHERISQRLAKLREQLRANGATALTPTPEWVALRKEVSLLNGKLK
jgi:hypothetical protein